jgi:N6-L-threonylcarbamoyladenine synthase
MVGMMAGKAIAAAHDKPFLAINHLEAHALTPRLTHKIDCPYLLLLVSGGHTQLLAVEDVGVYKRLGTTLDDALGECFDKSARMMGLPHPGGRYLEKAASHCKDPDAALTRFPLPHPMRGRHDPDFSFSGLKTAVRQHAQNLGTLTPDDIADLAYAFQRQAALIVCERTSVAIDIFINKYHSAPLVVSGGVAANQTIRNTLKELAYSKNMEFIAPPLNLCSDNGAMIAWAGIEKLKSGQQDPLDVAARPRWPLDPTADAKPGAGIKA